jgi:hypothetical protein
MHASSGIKYTKLSHDTQDAELGTTTLQTSAPQAAIPKNRSRLPILLLWAILAVTLLVAAVLLGRWLQLHSVSWDTAQTHHHCGINYTEAIALGCQFDLVTNNWLPKSCLDVETASEFRAWVLQSDRLHDPWPYFYDLKGEHRVESEEVMSTLVGRRVWTTTENHLGHCTFLMRRLHRSMQGKGRPIPHIDMSHTIHCSSSILKAIGNPGFEDRGEIRSGFDVGIRGC